ncbi:hypothetical protein SAMN05192560_1584 [Methylobacillus rhizosphaerae]|uniref:Uncharacterized protein n=1 Tax=Methylobacillus rhizosphaerae TaxID=551994 RepID=A0A238ZZ20_9PROT|nr:hypothetical protein [Methylobacillus rhizosphaerae]SNR88635.1 hypothetical protein SAMN05192560_1584 [Methylobacillus rhizosphaerae]
MSAHEHDFPATTKKQFILATLGSLFPPVLVLFLVARLFFSIQATHIDDPVAPQKPAAAEAAKSADTVDDEDQDDTPSAPADDEDSE